MEINANIVDRFLSKSHEISALLLILVANLALLRWFRYQNDFDNFDNVSPEDSKSWTISLGKTNKHTGFVESYTRKIHIGKYDCLYWAMLSNYEQI